MNFPDVNKSETTVSLDIEALTQDMTSEEDASPIDDYFRYIKVIAKTTRAREVHEDEELLKYLILSTVSAVEYYVRSVLANCVTVCPKCREWAAEQQLSLGSANYYNKASLGYALLEGAALSSFKEIKGKTNKITGVDISNGSSLDAALNSFNNVCQIRHAIVHSRGFLSGKNIRDLKLDQEMKKWVFVDIWKFQWAVASANNVVRAYNRTIFEELLQRWISRGVLEGEWHRDKKLFTDLFQVFYSCEDLSSRRAYDAYRGIQAYVRSRHAP